MDECFFVYAGTPSLRALSISSVSGAFGSTAVLLVVAATGANGIFILTSNEIMTAIFTGALWNVCSYLMYEGLEILFPEK